MSETKQSNPLATLTREAEVIEALRSCYDPEIPVNIYDLGLIYDVAIHPGGVVRVRMTLTSPHCPAAQTLPRDIETRIKRLPEISEVNIELVWDPPWTAAMMSEAARLTLGMF